MFLDAFVVSRFACWPMQYRSDFSVVFDLYTYYSLCIIPFEPRHEKTGFLPMRKQRRSITAVTAKLISAFVFATQIVQSLFFLNPRFQASSCLL